MGCKSLSLDARYWTPRARSVAYVPGSEPAPALLPVSSRVSGSGLVEMQEVAIRHLLASSLTPDLS